MSVDDYSDDNDDDYSYYNQEDGYNKTLSRARDSFTVEDDVEESFGDPNEQIRFLKEKLNLAAQAGLSLLKDSEDIKEKLAQSGSAYAKLMEELSAERHKNRQQTATLMMEYEGKMQEMQKEADEARQLTVNEILNSRQYVKLSEKFETAQLKIKDLESKVTHLENMRTSYPSIDQDGVDLEEALERSEAIAEREKTLLARIKELESGKEHQEKLIDDMREKLSDFEANSSSAGDMLTENNSLKKSIEKMKEQIEEKDNEINKEHELANRAIDECKRLSIQILLATEEMSVLKNKVAQLENIQIGDTITTSAETETDDSTVKSFFTRIVNRFMQ